MKVKNLKLLLQDQKEEAPKAEAAPAAEAKKKEAPKEEKK